MLILVDMDGVLVNFDKYLLQKCEERKEYELIQLLKNRTTMKLHNEKYEKIIIDIMKKPGFFYNLPVIDNCISALYEMEAEGYTVMICTTPTDSRCMYEKYLWIRDFLGDEWTRRMILTSDKTIIDGDYLIDDNAEITGYNKNPKWKHILFNQPYNRNENTKPRMKNWLEWRKFIT